MRVLNRLEQKLSSEPKFTDEEGKLLKSAVQTAALNLDSTLISLLLSDDELSDAFFEEVSGIKVFDKVKFAWAINNSEFLPDSFTAYSNKIGLIDENGSPLKQNKDVTLSFPYKDCVLEFDSTSEDEDRDEVFLNEILARNAIDTLFSEKVFTNTELHNKNSKHAVIEYSNENLVIKGNNLISLHSLLPRFCGRVKLMYWDILYNTNNDKVPYNDKFKHSSWLTMMKNRLEVALELLSDSGVIVLQCDDNEQAYLKVLCDEIFQRDNLINIICVNMSTVSGPKIQHAINGLRFPKTKEYLLMYAKSKSNVRLKVPKIQKTNWDGEYNKIVPEWKKEYISLYDLPLEEANEKVKTFRMFSLTDYCKENNIEPTDEWKWKNAYRIFAMEQNEALRKIANKETFSSDVAFIRSSSGALKLIGTSYNRDSSRARIELVCAEDSREMFISDNWTDLAVGGGVSYEGGVSLTNGKKPEKLLKRIIETFTSEGDLVLDAYFGSGTTGAVAMKLKRKFIGLEQLDSHYQMSLKRLDSVVGGEQGGISKDVGWNGGGSFISAELKQLNELLINKIIEADNDDDLTPIYSCLIESPFVLNYRVDPDIVQNIKNDSDFMNLSFEDKKKVLIALLDKNMIYVNKSDLNDSEFKCSEAEKAFNKSFYEV